ncbi:MAG TPA: hypothetical protein VKO85_04865 [Wenzhouxiangellaceae bacterium]|nr:hypothetical protein [Wenzhouxiangellaceae bacterium]
MTNTIPALLLLLFLAHLIGFAVIGLRRRQWYYLALVTTFGLLSAAFATQLIAPEAQVAGMACYQLLRRAAWLAAAVSISWTALRVLRNRRRRA